MRPGVLKRPGQTPSSATTTSSQLVGLPQVESLSQTDDLSGIVEPTKQISTQADIQTFLESIAFGRIMAFIYLLNEAALNKKLSDKVEVSEQVISVLNLLDELDSWIDDIPPEVAPQRFGNKAFRKWVAKLDAEADRLHDSLLGNIKDAKTELVPYFTHSFGNETRIDYGSGHELNFLVWLLGLYQVKFLNNQDNAAIVLRLFDRYLTLVRRLQRTYMLEPAGSHGVWGLDDYQFLPYLFGAAQLRDNKRIKPRSIANRELVDTYANEYMYFGAIRYIHEVSHHHGIFRHLTSSSKAVLLQNTRRFSTTLLSLSSYGKKSIKA